MLKFLFVLLLALYCSCSYSNSVQKLFLHIDKSIYVENENICFAAYLTGSEEALISKHRILSVFLLRDGDRSIIKSGQFVMQGGVASGLLTVPDTITGGNYHLYAYTDILDKNGQPMVDFIGKIIIKNTRPQKPGSTPSSVGLAGYEAVPVKDTLNIISVSIETEKENYAPRETVKIKISLKDQHQQEVKGLFSIAAVQTNRLADGYRKINIVDSDQVGQQLQSIDTVEDDEMTSFRRLPLVYSGQVLRNRKPVKKVTELVMLSSSGINSFETDQQGKFFIEPDLLYSESENMIKLLPKGAASTLELQFKNPFDSLNKVLATSLQLPVLSKNASATSEDFQLKEFEKYDELDKVTVTARTSNTLYGYKGKPGPNPCGDYVDEFDYLNYEFSKNRYQPIVGKQYKKRTDLDGLRTVFKVEPVHYTGCRTEEKKSGVNIEPIHYNQSLASVDELISDAQFLSTLLWKPFMLTENDGTLELSFVTGDIVGSFTIMIQGITDQSAFCGSKLITVKK